MVCNCGHEMDKHDVTRIGGPRTGACMEKLPHPVYRSADCLCRGFQPKRSDP